MKTKTNKVSDNKEFTPGPKSLKIFEEEQKYIAPGVQSIALFSKLVMEKGEGSYFIDIDGNRYLDMYAGVGVASLGHGHPDYAKAMSEQVSKINTGSFCSPRRANYCKTLAKYTPKGLTRIQFYSGGAEAVEAAIRLAKSYTKNYEVVGFWGGFHGKTGTVLGLLDDFKRELGPIMSGIHSVPYAYCYRCPFKMDYPSCGLYCVEFIRKQLKQESAGKIAAFLIEPIQGTNGNVVPPPDFLKAVKEVAKENNAVLICDEMICGFGRTGKMFGVEHFGVTPDIMTVGKGIANGFPVAGVISNDEIINSKPFANPSGSSSSYGGNPLAGCACDATLEAIIKYNLVENSRKVGEYLLNEFKKLQEKYRFIGDVRGKGLMIGVEMVSDRKTKKPLDKNITRRLFDECIKRGMISMCYSATIRVNPPLIITEKEAETAIRIYDEAFEAISKEFNI